LATAVPFLQAFLSFPAAKRPPPKCSYGLVERLTNTLLKNEESARDNHVLAGNFAKYSPI